MRKTTAVYGVRNTDDKDATRKTQHVRRDTKTP